MSPTADNALKLVIQYHRAWTSGDLEKAMSSLSDDFVGYTPAGSFSKDQYRVYLEGFLPSLIGIQDVDQFQSGQHAMLIYYPQTAVTSTTPAAEYFTVLNGLIVETVLIFDRQSYAPSSAAKFEAVEE